MERSFMNIEKQKYKSDKTSINTVNRVYKKYDFKPNSLILDYGGGAYDSNIKYMKEKNCNVLVYDPYNRSEQHNKQVFDYITKHNVDYVVCSNVLNVIEEDFILIEIFRNILITCPYAKVLFTVYEGDKSGVGKVTKKGYQRNLPYKAYIPIISKYFNIKEVKNGIIACERDKL